MHKSTFVMSTRAARFIPRTTSRIRALLGEAGGVVENISRSGLALSYEGAPSLTPGRTFPSLQLVTADMVIDCGPATVARLTGQSAGAATSVVGIAFEREQPRVIDSLLEQLSPYPYVTGELARTPTVESPEEHGERTLDQFRRDDAPDLFAKCTAFRSWTSEMQSTHTYQRLFRVTLTSGIDAHITVVDPNSGTERVMLCFDSNSYLGLHRHPRVIEEVKRVTDLVGYGTPSAQLLCGTNRYLRELEQELAEFHGREDTIVFPTGFAANVGALHALLRDNDAVVRDQYAHASIHEGCRTSSARINKIFAHNRTTSLDRVLTNAANAGCSGKLVVTDGVFSMHGRIAPLPELVDVCKKHNARLMVDDAHGVGVIGASGGGIEEHFAMPGAVDVLMGTFSKTLGCVGGYVCGSRDLVDYLRWFAPSGLFTTALPAPACAGIQTALRLVRSEPEHRERLWEHIHTFVPALRDAGFITSDPVSPIVTVFIGAQSLLLEVSRELFAAGIKCGNVIYPAVGKSDCILRFTLNARHSDEDIEYTIDTLTRIGKNWGLLGRTREEVQELGRQLISGRRPAA
jgi:glycine C-acetyltransferase